MITQSVKRSVFWNCYDEGWGELITPESFAHPAKMAKGLVYRIVRHGIEQGYWRKGDTLLDPFGGIGTTGIAASAHGLNSILVELEYRFVQLAMVNFALHEREWELMGCPQPVILQGDSRYLRDVVSGVINGALTSPPYADSVNSGKSGIDFTKISGRSGEPWGQASHENRYGDNPANIGQLKSRQVGALTSPPYEEGLGHGGKGNEIDEAKHLNSRLAENAYGNGNENIGNGKGETYWDACRQVYSGLHDLISPGGASQRPTGAVAAIVVKSFVRNKAIVPLPEMTAQLLEDVGFEVIEWTDAMLVAEDSQLTMEGGEYRKERKSFFRRLAERKGSPRIDSEVVLWARA